MAEVAQAERQQRAHHVSRPAAVPTNSVSTRATESAGSDEAAKLGADALRHLVRLLGRQAARSAFAQDQATQDADGHVVESGPAPRRRGSSCSGTR